MAENERETGISIQFASSCVGRGGRPDTRQGFLNFQSCFGFHSSYFQVSFLGPEIENGPGDVFNGLPLFSSFLNFVLMDLFQHRQTKRGPVKIKTDI